MSILNIIVFIIIILGIVGMIIWVNQPRKRPTHTLKAKISVKNSKDKVLYNMSDDVEEDLGLSLIGSLEQKEISFKYEPKDDSTMNIIINITTTLDKISRAYDKLREWVQSPDLLSEQVFDFDENSEYSITKVFIFTGSLDHAEQEAIRAEEEIQKAALERRAREAEEFLDDGVTPENATEAQVVAAEEKKKVVEKEKEDEKVDQDKKNRCMRVQDLLPQGKTCDNFSDADLNYAVTRSDPDNGYVATNYDLLMNETAVEIDGSNVADFNKMDGGIGEVWFAPCIAHFQMPLAVKAKECLQIVNRRTPYWYKIDDNMYKNSSWFRKDPGVCKDLQLFLDITATVIATKLAQEKERYRSSSFPYIKIDTRTLKPSKEYMNDHIYYFKKDDYTDEWKSVECSPEAAPGLKLPSFEDAENAITKFSAIADKYVIKVGTEEFVLDKKDGVLKNKECVEDEKCEEDGGCLYTDAAKECGARADDEYTAERLKVFAYPSTINKWEPSKLGEWNDGMKAVAEAQFPPQVFHEDDYLTIAQKQATNKIAEEDVKNVHCLLDQTHSRLGKKHPTHISNTPLPKLLFQQSMRCYQNNVVNHQACNNMWSLAVEYTKDAAQQIDEAEKDKKPTPKKLFNSNWKNSEDIINTKNLSSDEEKWFGNFTLKTWNERCK